MAARLALVFERTVTYPAAYTHLEPSRDAEILLALQWLAKQQEAIGGEILVLAPGLSNLDNSEVIARYRRSLRCMSEVTFKKRSHEWNGGPALALWPTASMMALIDENHRTRAVAAVPWLLDDIGPWVRARRPIDLLGIAGRLSEAGISDPVVRIAMEHLSIGVNLSTGLTHPSDKARAVETFRVLRRGGHRWVPEEIQAWALGHGWRNRGAEDLRKYAAGVLEGKTFRTAGFGLNPSVLEAWRQQAAGQAGGPVTG